jgi:hypothetical protein
MLLKVSEPFDSAKNERWQEDQKCDEQVGPHAKPPGFELGQNKNGLSIPMVLHNKAGILSGYKVSRSKQFAPTRNGQRIP